MKNFRKPYLSIIMASIFLFVSCSQYESNAPENQINNKFDDISIDYFKNNIPTLHSVMKELKNMKFNKKNNKSIDNQNKILDIVNKNYNTDIQINGNVLELTKLSPEGILTKSLNKGWINKVDVDLTNSFINNLELNGFDTAIEKYKIKVNSLNLSKEEFSRKNEFVNTLSFIKYQNPNYFKLSLSSSSNKSGVWDCIKATVCLVGASAGLAGCATIFACAISVACFIIAADNFMDNCVGAYLENYKIE